MCVQHYKLEHELKRKSPIPVFVELKLSILVARTKTKATNPPLPMQFGAYLSITDDATVHLQISPSLRHVYFDVRKTSQCSNVNL